MKKKKFPWLGIFVGTAISGLIAVITVTILVDPFFQYHAPLPGFPYIVDNQLSQNPGMAKHFTYDSVILGSSMTVNFETDWFRDLYGEETVKLSYNGAYPREEYRIMDIIFHSQQNIKCVYLGIDPVSYSAEVTSTKFPLPEYLYDHNLFNDVSYVLNKDVFLNYILKPMASPGHKTEMSKVYKQWWTDPYYNLGTVLYQYTEPEPVLEPVDTNAFAEATRQNMEVNILPYIENNPQTEFVIFFPPYSILFWHDMIVENRLDATLMQYQVITESLLSHENVKVFLFADQENIICDFNQYADYTHYHTRINYYMAECFGNEGCRIEDMETLKERLAKLRELALQYDFDTLLRKNKQ